MKKVYIVPTIEVMDTEINSLMQDPWSQQKINNGSGTGGGNDGGNGPGGGGGGDIEIASFRPGDINKLYSNSSSNEWFDDIEF